MQGLNVLKSLPPTPRMPVAFIGHGNPMNTIELNRFTSNWRKLGAELPRPQAFVVISAHWLTHGTAVTGVQNPGMIYDMYGFPEVLYQFQYPSPGDPELAKKLQQQLLQYEAILDQTRGIDHGTYSIMAHIAPDADIPVLQISIDYDLSHTALFDLFQSLRELREHGVLFIGSGNIVHNLGMINFQSGKPHDWALEFDETIAVLLTKGDYKATATINTTQGAARLAVPTDDHYRPMLASLALLHSDEQLLQFNDEIEMASVSMRSFVSTN